MNATHRRAGNREKVWVVLGVTLAAAPVMVPVVLRTFSCGYDLPFHLGSWQDAQQQIRHGAYPEWNYAAAHGAGEPRFVFYPPLSWLLGAFLSLFAHGLAASNLFIAVAFVCCWTTMYWTVSRTVSRAGAMVAASVYAAGPYIVYDALQRSAMGELLACAWLPLIFAAMLGARVRVRLLAASVAMLCLTNIPATVMGVYLVVLLALLRLFPALLPEGGAGDRRSAGEEIARAGVGVGLGMAVAGFFLVPALCQRHEVQLGAAFAPGLRFSDNFLLRHTADTHRGAIHVTSVLVAQYGGVLLLLWGWLYFKKRLREVWVGVIVSGAVLFLLLPISSEVWRHAPALGVLQFPWRLTAILCVVLSLTVGVALRKMEQPRTGAVAAMLTAWVLMAFGAHQYWLSPGSANDQGIPRAQAVVEEEPRATPEYTPIHALELPVGTAVPAFRVVDARSPLSFEAGAGTDAVTPSHLDLQVAEPAWLVLKTRDYSRWAIYRNGKQVGHADFMGHMVVRLDAGASSIDVRWKEGVDEIAGMGVSLAALACLRFMRCPQWLKPPVLNGEFT